MEMTIDGLSVTAAPGESLLQLVRRLQLDSDSLASRPLAAKMAGEVFTLNYVPVRLHDDGSERESLRRAAAAAAGAVRLLRYSDPAGRGVFVRTVQFVCFLAVHSLWPNAKASMNCTLGSSIYFEVTQTPDFDAAVLKQKVSELIRQDIVLQRRRVPLEEAVDRYRSSGQEDKARLLSMRSTDYFDEYAYGDFADYYYGELAPSTGYLQTWDLLPVDGGFLFVCPDENVPDRLSEVPSMPHVFSVFSEGEQWGRLMECTTAADLNEMTASGRIRELIRVNEALHEARFSQIADMICGRGARAVMLAGPSSSGKTTSANRLAIQLKVRGKQPIPISLDDYYLDRDRILPGPDGRVDLEHINTLDIDLFKSQLAQLLAGGEVELPRFNFITGKRERSGNVLRLSEHSVLIVEGLHGLNPAMLPADIAAGQIFRMYISPLLPLNLDNHNRIPTSYLRLLRRTVRDYETRGASVQHTLSMWESVQQGERRWIYPYQENADVIFNSSALYELAVLKRHIFPLLTDIQPEDECYDAVHAMVRILNYIQEADVDDEIPPTSIIREFIGGNTFYRQ